MVTRVITTTNTNRQNLSTITDTQRLARALRRANLIRRYSHGTIKRSAMAMINHYMRQAHNAFASRRGYDHHVGARRELHVVM